MSFLSISNMDSIWGCPRGGFVVESFPSSARARDLFKFRIQTAGVGDRPHFWGLTKCGEVSNFQVGHLLKTESVLKWSTQNHVKN